MPSVKKRQIRFYGLSIGFALLLGGIAASLTIGVRASVPAAPLPLPALDTQAGQPEATEIAVLSGGCFWGVQGVFEHVTGVTRAVSGYAGGKKETASYEQVSSGRTGHAESVEVTFDPHKISYGQILQIFFTVALDPTELNRQGPDEGTQYRSEIWYSDETQHQIAQSYIAQLDKAHVFDAPIVTRVDANSGFFPAEDYHQDFLVRHPNYPYIVFNDLPKVANLKRMFPQAYLDKPVLVLAGQNATE
ncbi:MAG TPA: peptide-methionine (S)-S-oxide reductase MsrA [Beijerinckiaceae bacterium]|jgi:peptide-methionine (S)-S-oxide reductase|nr:peptide-methionine (S)-S-oxide reductase MsrA [Beijerinckiaceae bacterium]